jgi:hypothetical protein
MFRMAYEKRLMRWETGTSPVVAGIDVTSPSYRVIAKNFLRGWAGSNPEQRVIVTRFLMNFPSQPADKL